MTEMRYPQNLTWGKRSDELHQRLIDKNLATHVGGGHVVLGAEASTAGVHNMKPDEASKWIDAQPRHELPLNPHQGLSSGGAAHEVVD